MRTAERNLRELRLENESFGTMDEFGGTAEEFCDLLDTEEREKFEEIRNVAEQKKKWLRMFEKMQSQIASRNFDDAMDTFEQLCEELA